MIRVEIDNASVVDALQRLTARVQNLSPALKEIGEDLAKSTKERFRTGTAPDGTPWAPNSSVTVAIYNGRFASPGAKKPLLGETRRLASEISWQLTSGATAVEIGSSLPYASMQQFGGSKAQWPHLWGDIPARPYLGISADDEANILSIVGSYLLP